MELCRIGPFNKCGRFTPEADDWVPSKVVFTLKGGGDSDKRAAAERGLKVGQSYEVENIDVGDWYSYIRLKGFDASFNEAMFEQEAKSGGARTSYPSAVAGRLCRCGVSPAADSGEFKGSKGTGDDCRGLHVGPVLKGVLIALLVVVAVCLDAVFFKGPIGWRDIAAACVVSAAVVCAGLSVLRLVVGRRGRG